jgi:hypothetical protein
MRGGYHAYNVKDSDMVINEEQQGKSDDDIINDFFNEKLEKNNYDIETTKHQVFDINGEVSKKRNIYKQWNSWILDGRYGTPKLQQRVQDRRDDFLRKGSYNDLYWDLKSTIKESMTTEA